MCTSSSSQYKTTKLFPHVKTDWQPTKQLGTTNIENTQNRTRIKIQNKGKTHTKWNVQKTDQNEKPNKTKMLSKVNPNRAEGNFVCEKFTRLNFFVLQQLQ